MLTFKVLEILVKFHPRYLKIRRHSILCSQKYSLKALLWKRILRVDEFRIPWIFLCASKFFFDSSEFVKGTIFGFSGILPRPYLTAIKMYRTEALKLSVRTKVRANNASFLSWNMLESIPLANTENELLANCEEYSSMLSSMLSPSRFF